MAMPVQKLPATPAVKPIRVVRGRQSHAKWIHVHGPPGVGKSSFAAGAPDPLFLDVEHGTTNLDVTRYQFDDDGRTMPLEYPEFLEAVRVVECGDHQYKTVAIDTVDAVESLIWTHICKRDGKKNIAEYGFAKGENIVALDEWRQLVACLERIRARGINVVTLSHSVVKHFNDPDSEGWDRYIPKLHEKAAGLIQERANAMLFAQFEVVRKPKDGDGRKIKAALTGARFLYTKRTGAYEAKNRYDLPDEIPLDWRELEAAIAAHRPASPEDLVVHITRNAERIGGEVKETALKYMAESGSDAVKLSKVNTWLNAKLAEAGIKEE